MDFAGPKRGPAAEQPTSADSSPATWPARRPSIHPTFTDIVRNLDVHALSVLSGHLKALACREQARASCRALRDALDAVDTHVYVELSSSLAPELQPGPPSPLLRKPCCSSVHINLVAARLADAHRQQQRRPTTAAHPAPNPEDLLAWPFEALPPHRRQQITRLKLSLTDFLTHDTDYSYPNLPRALARLGALLPALTHVDITDCGLCGLHLWYSFTSEQLCSTLASAFPNLTSLAITMSYADMDLLVRHLGDRLEVLQLSGLGDEPRYGLLRHLCGMRRLRELGFSWCQWRARGWAAVEDHDGDDDGGSSALIEYEDEEEGSQDGSEAGAWQEQGEGEGEQGQGQEEAGGEGQAGEGGAAGGAPVAHGEAVGVGGEEAQPFAQQAGAEQGPEGAEAEGGEEADRAWLLSFPASTRFRTLLGSLPPSLEQLRFRNCIVPSRDRSAGEVGLRDLGIALGEDGRVQVLCVGWKAGLQELEHVESWVRRSRLAPRHGKVPQLVLDGIQHDGSQQDIADFDWHIFLQRRFHRIDVRRLRLCPSLPAETLAAVAHHYVPQQVEVQGLAVRLRAAGPVGVPVGCYRRGRLRLPYAYQRIRGRGVDASRAAGQVGACDAGEGGVGAGKAAEAGGGLELQTAGPEQLEAAALGPLRRALAAAAAAGAGAGVEGRQGVRSFPGLAVVPAGSRCSWHRLVLLHGPFFAALGSGRALREWLVDLEGNAQTWVRLSCSRGDASKRSAGGKAEPRLARYLRLSAGREEDGDGSGAPRGAAGGSTVHLVVECGSAELAEGLCALAEELSTDSGGCLRAVRLAGASLEETVLRPCVQPVGNGVRSGLGCAAWQPGCSCT